MTHPPLDIEQRLSRLESSNRRLILAVGILSGLVGGLILLRAVDSRRSAETAEAVPAASATAMSAAVLYLKTDGSLRFRDEEGGVTARFPDTSP